MRQARRLHERTLVGDLPMPEVLTRPRRLAQLLPFLLHRNAEALLNIPRPRLEKVDLDAYQVLVPKLLPDDAPLFAALRCIMSRSV